MEEVRPEIVLELAEGLAQRRLGDVQGSSRPVHATFIDDGEEVAELPQVHVADRTAFRRSERAPQCPSEPFVITLSR
ncbi:hypothetical protein GCM10023199_10130 [Actinomycetospora chibensis]